jgi:four helix bundle protein
MCVHATCVEDLLVFQRARAFTVAVFAVTRDLRADFWLSDQLDESAESMMANIRYLAIAAGSAEEARVHLLALELRGLVAHSRSSELRAEAREIASMLGALIRYLRRSDRKHRSV